MDKSQKLMPSEIIQTQKNCIFYGNIYTKYPESVNLREKILVNLDCDCKNAHGNLGLDRNPTKLNCAILWHSSIN